MGGLVGRICARCRLLPESHLPHLPVQLLHPHHPNTTCALRGLVSLIPPLIPPGFAENHCRSLSPSSA